MAGRIPPDFIQQLLASTDLAEVIGQSVALKRAGGEYKACCPFHNEKTPSFTVSPRKGFYHCFGCSAHGTAITFLMEYSRYSFMDAIEELASRAGMEVPRTGGAGRPSQELEPLYQCMEAACDWYRKALSESEQAQEYIRQRGLNDEACKEYLIGYAPPGYSNIEKEMEGRFSREILLKVGLLSNKEGRIYDKFRNRLMFPIRDYRGRTLGFGGRVIDPEDKPKYLNSPETPLFHKSRVLYGVHEMQQRRGSPKYLVLTEGYMDVVGLAQGGVHNALATLGTATTENHIRQLGRFCRVFVFCFDGDRAGREAGWRALKNLLPVLREGDEVRFSHLPEGEDPDSYIRANGRDAWKKFIGQAMPLEEYFFDTLSRDLKLDTVSGKSALVAKARPLLGEIGAPVYRDLLTQKLAGITGLSESQLRMRSSEPQRQPRAGSPRPSGRPSAVRVMIRLLLEYPGLAKRAMDPEKLRTLAPPGFRLLAKIVELARGRPTINAAGIIESFRGEEAERHLTSLMSWVPVEMADAKGAQDLYGVFDEITHRFREMLVKQELSVLNVKQTRGEGLSAAELERFENLKKERITLSRARAG